MLPIKVNQKRALNGCMYIYQILDVSGFVVVRGFFAKKDANFA